MKPHTEKFLQKRKLFMALPVLTIPFLTIIFWALGGGQGPAEAKEADTSHLIASVPDANFKAGETWNKFDLYELAARDSAEFKEARESDPYFDLIAFQEKQSQNPQKDSKGNLIESFKTRDRMTVDPNEEKVNNKLQQLYRELNKASEPAVSPDIPNAPPAYDPQFTQDVQKLESMMELMNEQPQADPEMQELSAMLEKIMDIQHPERVKERMKSEAKLAERKTYSVSTPVKQEAISLLASSGNKEVSLYDSLLEVIQQLKQQQELVGFYDLEDQPATPDSSGNVIRAVVHDAQKVVTGATLKMRLLQDVEINGIKVFKDQLISGTCTISGERLMVTISSILAGDNLLPVSLTVYDTDGLEGIHIPGAITRDAAKQASDDAIQNMQLMSLDQSLGAQAASAGIEATKGLLSKKAKLVEAKVKAEHKIFLVQKS